VEHIAHVLAETYALDVTRIAGIGALARLNRDESELSDRQVEDYVVVDFSLFAELQDGRRVDTATIAQYGGYRDVWGEFQEGVPTDMRLSRLRLESTVADTIGPEGDRRRVWEGISTRLEIAGVRVSNEELLAAPFRVEISPDLDELVPT
jgi:hypothetical protein